MDKKQKRSDKTVGIKVFLTSFCLMREGTGSMRPKNTLPEQLFELEMMTPLKI
jgi:hypothetical protein